MTEVFASHEITELCSLREITELCASREMTEVCAVCEATEVRAAALYTCRTFEQWSIGIMNYATREPVSHLPPSIM